MIGGANCEGVMGEATHREFAWVDFVMSGEVDDFIGTFCARVLREGASLTDLPEGVFGRGRRSRVGQLGLTAPRAVVRSLDQTGVPDYDDYFDALSTASAGAHVKPALLFESSRGCWWGMKHHCTFCGLNGEGMSFRSKSPGRVDRGADVAIPRAAGAGRRQHHRHEISRYRAARARGARRTAAALL
jgi:magnesium-protoporphyrin IX monomethyl ester (oxidative) cyclase